MKDLSLCRRNDVGLSLSKSSGDVSRKCLSQLVIKVPQNRISVSLFILKLFFSFLLLLVSANIVLFDVCNAYKNRTSHQHARSLKSGSWGCAPRGRMLACTRSWVHLPAWLQLGVAIHANNLSAPEVGPIQPKVTNYSCLQSEVRLLWFQETLSNIK